MEALAPQPWAEQALGFARLQPASHVITLIRPVISTELLGALLHRLSSVASKITGTRTMATHPCTALEFTVELDHPIGNAEAALRAALSDLGSRCNADITVRRANSRRRLVVFDVDSTLVRGEVVDALAAHVGRKQEIRTLTDQAMRGELDFADSLRQRVQALAGLPAHLLDQHAAGLELTPGALVTIRALQAQHIRVGLISGGFAPVVAQLASSLGLDFFAANHPEILDGKLTGKLTGKLIDGPAKAAQLRHFAAAEGIPMAECVAVGDGANDIDMIAAAGLGIAFNAAPPVRAAANAVISYPRLDLVLPLLGIPVPCAVVDAPWVA